MSKVYIIPFAISLILGIARAQVSQGDMRIGSLNNFQRNELSGDDNNLKELDLESYRDVTSLENAISPDKYILGPGDELGISIIMGENLTLPTKITPTGDLFIPSVGLVNVSGQTLDEARKKIKAFIIENAFPNAKVSIALLNIRKFQIQIVGAVNSSGFVEISALDRLDKIIFASGGFHPLAKEFDIFIKRGKDKEEKINFLNFLREGDLKSNPTFLEGDIIHVPFGDTYLNSVSLRGYIENGGYDIIENNESLLSFLNRSIDLINETNLMSVIVTRNENGSDKIYNVNPKEFSNFILLNGDIIDIPRDDGIMVNGFVQKPGAYAYVPGYLAYNYISMAGGNTKDGSVNKIKIIHTNGTSSRNPDTMLKRGDVIIVERSTINTLAGNMSILQIVASLLTIYMTYLSSSK